MSLAMPNSDATFQAAPALKGRTQARARDLRLDFFRGLALLIIFVDHVSGNGLAAFTLQGLGFADAAEIFVFIAGMAGVLAYRSTILNKGLAAGMTAIAARLRQLYFAHLLMVGGVLLFAMAVLLSGSSFDVIGKLGLQPLLDDPASAAIRLPFLAFLPYYLDILPLYIALFAVLPFIIMGLRRHPLLPLAAALASYALAHKAGINLPNFGHADGWFLNPLAWALLFTLGATAAELTMRDAWRKLPRGLVAAVTVAAAAFALIGFLQAAPWRAIPAAHALVAFDLGLEPSKTLLSWPRLLDILCKVWLAAVLVPRGAAFMSAGLGGAISRAGRHSLPIFIAGMFLSLGGSVLLHEAGAELVWQVVVNVGGTAALLGLAWGLDQGRFAAWNPSTAFRALAGSSRLSAS